jgi:hypothetical protein
MAKKLSKEHMKEYAHMSAEKLKKHMKEEKSLLKEKKKKKPCSR